MNMKVGEKYLIKWVDTFSKNGWYTDEEIKKESKKATEFLTSVGIFAGEYYGFIVLCNEFATEVLTSSPYGHPNWIPKGCIKKIVKLK